MKSKLEISDILIIVGLCSLGSGLYLYFNLGVSLTVIGIILFVYGLFTAK